MKQLHLMSKILSAAAGAALIFGASAAAGETEEFEERRVLIEINATDGDAGFHALVDGDAWKEAKLSGSKLFDAKAKGSLREQGLTEIFFESDEPPCDESVADDPEDVVTVGEVLERFPAGPYRFTGKSIEPGVKLEGGTILTHELPAAPDITGCALDEVCDGSLAVDPDDAVIVWAPGDDLGVCDVPAGITAPAEVLVVFWEVVVEPDDELPAKRVFSVQVPVGTTSVQVSPQYLNSYADEDVTEFKFEVGAVEARMIDDEVTKGNQTFSEGTFELED